MPFKKGDPKPPGSGLKRGQKIRATLEKEAARAAAREIIFRELQPMTEAQAAHAKGVSYMVLRQPDGTFARATDVKQIDAACAVGASAFKIFTQAPNTQAYQALWDRALDKPKEQVEMEISGTLDITTVLKARHAKRHGK